MDSLFVFGFWNFMVIIFSIWLYGTFNLCELDKVHKKLDELKKLLVNKDLE